MVTVLLGGQIGSEGKGKIAAYLANEFDLSIRSGGPNAGHTVISNGEKMTMRLIPCAFINKKCLLAMSAGSLIDVDILLQEMETLKIDPASLIIDPQAGIIEQKHKDLESSMKSDNMSSGCGVGYATSDKILRKEDFKLAKDIEALAPYLNNVEKMANEYIDSGKKVMVEGTQGFDLSIHHGSYPYVTSRDTTAATFCGEIGLSPKVVEDIILVLRTFPIRSCKGPINELTWEDVTNISQSTKNIIEYASVTKKVRRVGQFDEEMLEKAIRINRPTQLALNFVDYLDAHDYKVRNYSDLSYKTKKFIEELERKFNVPVTLIGTGEGIEDTIDLRGSLKQNASSIEAHTLG
ncbi:adenylosuccinate synthetase [Paenibacillus sp. 1011MAR3C5]|uniref:adenylosuccinate synthetase n=1 Tax=Paenibacillus sp. 1011MAR3C5 TaxID=1675787 RepID=UPI000E6D280D|nr:adenylosuccinate synthetase [Paenibacillus sp. 1011MAR3C5]RJE89668.1 adenylosuccinate synthetase [Paenibacillus sp. 1011MAR3C5]